MSLSCVVPPSASRNHSDHAFQSERYAALHRRVEDIIARRRREAKEAVREWDDLLPDDDKFDTTPTLTVELQAQESEGIEAATGAHEEAESVSASYTPSSCHISLPSSSISSSITKPKPKPRWRDLDPYQKLQTSIEAAGRRGGHAFSLNLGIGREGALFNSDDPARRLSLEINRALRRSLDHVIPYNFVLELTRDSDGYERLHVHGSFIPGKESLADIQDALTRAAGGAIGTLGGDRQLDARPIYNAAGWASYVTKAKRWGKAQPNGRHVFINQALSQIARQDHPQYGLAGNILFKRKRKSAGKKKVHTPAKKCACRLHSCYNVA
jgi:hypothetical protein